MKSSSRCELHRIVLVKRPCLRVDSLLLQWIEQGRGSRTHQSELARPLEKEEPLLHIFFHFFRVSSGAAKELFVALRRSDDLLHGGLHLGVVPISCCELPR